MDKCQGFWKDIWSLLQGGDNEGSPALSLKSGEADISSVLAMMEKIQTGNLSRNLL
jgi:hypothetical protein